MPNIFSLGSGRNDSGVVEAYDNYVLGSLSEATETAGDYILFDEFESAGNIGDWSEDAEGSVFTIGESGMYVVHLSALWSFDESAAESQRGLAVVTSSFLPWGSGGVEGWRQMDAEDATEVNLGSRVVYLPKGATVRASTLGFDPGGELTTASLGILRLDS